MRPTAHRLLLLLTMLALLVPPAAAAQEIHTFTASVAGGFGGALDANPGDELGNTALQLGFSLVTEPSTRLGFRLGQVDLDIAEGFGSLFGAELTYATAAGEYRFSHGFYESGIYAGLGAYQLDGRRFGGASVDDTSIGAVLGLTGEFDLTRRFSFIIELSGHYADLEEAQTYLFGHFGLAAHF